MRIDIKPLSVNEAWRGRRFKTPKYKAYEKAVLLLLPKFDVPEGPLFLFLEFGLSSRAADIDNPVKCFVDCLQKKYGFDDKMIYRLTVQKIIVKKGEEYIKFNVQTSCTYA